MIPPSHAILTQMYQDEQHHATQAVESGGEALPLWVKDLMKGMSKVMTTVAFWV